MDMFAEQPKACVIELQRLCMGTMWLRVMVWRLITRVMVCIGCMWTVRRRRGTRCGIEIGMVRDMTSVTVLWYWNVGVDKREGVGWVWSARNCSSWIWTEGDAVSAADRWQNLLYPARWKVKMDPLAVVEEQLGRVDMWPSGVLSMMFSCDEPNVWWSRRFGAFMYGNGVWACDALKLYIWHVRGRMKGRERKRRLRCTDGICGGVCVVLLEIYFTIIRTGSVCCG